MKQPRVLSLFSGAGGLDIGFCQESFKIVACIEIDQDACDTLAANAGKHLEKSTKIYCKDITKIAPDQLRKEIGEIDFMIGGPPCQSFSAAGRRAGGGYGVNDTRGSLFWYYAQLIKEFQPKGFLFENVKGILQANKKSDWDTIQASFSELGYNLNHTIIDAADFGTPQHRERLILVGLREQASFQFPRPSHGPNSITNQPFLTPRTAFEDIDDPYEVVPKYSGKYGHLLVNIPPGFNYLFYTERMSHPTPLFAWRSKFSGFLYKLDPDEPTKTLVAHQGKYDGPFHWRNRKLTIPELIRIQGYPSSYEFVGSKISVQKQIGNSVAPKMGRALAKAVAKQLFGKKNDVELLGDDEVLKRKLRARVARNQNRKPTRENDFNQLDMFPVVTKWKCSSRKLNIGLNNIEARCELKNGALNIKSRNTEKLKGAGFIRLELSFVEPVADAFNKIVCELESSDPFDFCFAWDCIHKSVDQYTSYEDLTPLYGHFTEPYPKFVVTPSINAMSTIPLSFLKWISNYENLSRIHSRNHLEDLFEGVLSFAEISSFLRSKRVDIRIHETNRTIPEDHFRVCYPYTIPHWKPTFITWRGTGLHRTADLRIEDLIKKVKS